MQSRWIMVGLLLLITSGCVGYSSPYGRYPTQSGNQYGGAQYPGQVPNGNNGYGYNQGYRNNGYGNSPGYQPNYDEDHDRRNNGRGYGNNGYGHNGYNNNQGNGNSPGNKPYYDNDHDRGNSARGYGQPRQGRDDD